MDIELEVERSRLVAVPRAATEGLFADFEATLRRFPRLRKLSRTGDNELRWDLRTIGSRVARIAHDVSYAARYELDAAKQRLTWTPVPGLGNAQLEGCLAAHDEGERTRLSFRMKGQLTDVPVPLMYRLIAPAFIQGKFSAMIDAFLDRTAESLKDEAAAGR